MRDGLARRDLRWCLIGTCFFWLSGMVYVSLAPLLAQDVLGGGEGATTLILTSFALGVGVGAIGISRLLKGRLTTAAAPAAAGVIALAATAVLYLAAIDPAAAQSAFVADGSTGRARWSTGRASRSPAAESPSPSPAWR
jgi:predicted MFS family arabinose efflux permease